MENVRKYRKKRGLTQSELAELTGVSVVTISKLEQPKFYNVSLETLMNIALALDVKIGELVTEKMDLADEKTTLTIKSVKTITLELKNVSAEEVMEISRPFETCEYNIPASMNSELYYCSCDGLDKFIKNNKGKITWGNKECEVDVVMRHVRRVKNEC